MALLSFFAFSFFSLYALLYIFELKRLDVTRISAERLLSRAVVQKAGEVEVRVEVRNELNERLPCELRDVLPQGLTLVSGHNVEKGVLEGDSALSVSYKAKVLGNVWRVAFRTVDLVVYDPLKLVARLMKLKAYGEIRVLAESAEYAGSRVFPRLAATTTSLGIGLNPFSGTEYEYAGLKEYTYGDKPRDIHWLRTAYLQDDEAILAKRYVMLSEAKTAFVIDSSSGIAAGPRNEFLHQVRAILGRLGRSLLSEGNYFRVVILNAELEEGHQSSLVDSVEKLAEVLSLIYPSQDAVDVSVIGRVAEEIGRASTVILFTNMPSENSPAVKVLLASLATKGCKVLLVYPETRSYYLSSEPLSAQLLKLDFVVKERLLSALPEGVLAVQMTSPESEEEFLRYVRQLGVSVR